MHLERPKSRNLDRGSWQRRKNGRSNLAWSRHVLRLSCAGSPYNNERPQERSSEKLHAVSIHLSSDSSKSILAGATVPSVNGCAAEDHPIFRNTEFRTAYHKIVFSEEQEDTRYSRSMPPARLAHRQDSKATGLATCASRIVCAIDRNILLPDVAQAFAWTNQMPAGAP
jgi:hypothetical protein